MRILGLIVAILCLVMVSFRPYHKAFAEEQRSQSDTIDDRYPTFIKVYSEDGRESLTATCIPSGDNVPPERVTCKFINVRFMPPKTDESLSPFTMENVLKENELGPSGTMVNNKELEQKYKKALYDNKREICSSENWIASIKKKIGDPSIGPKRKDYFEQLISACSEKDSAVLFQRLTDLERRKCELWVDQFSLDFKRTGQGQWLFQQEKPGQLSKVLKIYELNKDGLGWTLTETRVPTEGANKKTTRTVWSWKNYKEYELPCDFISHKYIQVP